MAVQGVNYAAATRLEDAEVGAGSSTEVAGAVPSALILGSRFHAGQGMMRP